MGINNTEDYKILEYQIKVLKLRIKILEEENATLSNCNANLQDEVKDLKWKIEYLEEKILELAIIDKNKRRINMISKNDLDKRICDLEGGSNEQTYREYIRETEEKFGIGEMDIEELTQTEFQDYLRLLDWLWTK